MKKFSLLLSGLFFIISVFATSKASIPIKEGVDYTVIATSPITKNAKNQPVNVKEFFAFACIHCKDLEPLLETYMKTNAKKVNLEKIHAVWGEDPTMQGLAKLNATLQMLKLNQLYQPVFNAIFARQNLTDRIVLKSFLATNKLKPADIDKFFAVYDSFDVNAMVGKYKTMTLNPVYGINGTPTIIVADKYILKPAQAPRLIEVINTLVNMNNKAK
ncbi:MAG: thiol:disulfide interchange protein DsbA/DsbL [Burkholderiales bacterium]|nr:thiol:disulfide interchange protein DsbA/DsbL [Burkholderiales bacterium]